MKNVFSEIEKRLSFCISVEGDTFEQYFWNFFLWKKTLCIGLSLKKKLISSNIIVEKIEKLIGTGLLEHAVLFQFTSSAHPEIRRPFSERDLLQCPDRYIVLLILSVVLINRSATHDSRR